PQRDPRAPTSFGFWISGALWAFGFWICSSLVVGRWSLVVGRWSVVSRRSSVVGSPRSLPDRQEQRDEEEAGRVGPWHLDEHIEDQRRREPDRDAREGRPELAGVAARHPVREQQPEQTVERGDVANRVDVGRGEAVSRDMGAERVGRVNQAVGRQEER